jgi:uncharacterized protein (TIGR02594 family)
MFIFDLQQALTTAGFPPGPLDGINGPLTRAALRAFQGARGLEVDGIVGPITQAALAGRNLVADDLPWMIEAARHLGVNEAAGGPGAVQIARWAADLGMKDFIGFRTSWCGLFAAHCLHSTLPDAVLPHGYLAARKWLDFGQAITPRPGAVMVFWREALASWKGHVGFCAGEDATHFHILGGNQDNQVSLARWPKAKLLGARWPVDAP